MVLDGRVLLRSGIDDRFPYFIGAKKWGNKMISGVLSTNRKPAGNSRRLRKKRKTGKISLTDAVRRVFYYQKKFPGQFAVFSISRDLSICKTDGARFDSFRRCYPDNLIGIYDRHLKIGDLVEDLQEYFSDEVQA